MCGSYIWPTTILKYSPGQADLPDYPHGQVIPKQCRDSEFTAISNYKNEFPTWVAPIWPTTILKNSRGQADL